jgi:hypothetical protein
MRDLFGSRDPRALGEAFVQLERRVAYLKPRRRRAYHASLDEFGPAMAACYRAIYEGVPIRGLTREDVHHMDAAKALAHVGQSHRMIDFDDWKMVWAFVDFDKDWSRKLAAPARRLMHYLRDGRPVLGPKLDISGAYYGYLLREEAVVLREALAGLRAAHPPLGGEDPSADFVGAVIGALAEVTRHRLDVWFYAS